MSTLLTLFFEFFWGMTASNTRFYRLLPCVQEVGSFPRNFFSITSVSSENIGFSTELFLHYFRAFRR